MKGDECRGKRPEHAVIQRRSKRQRCRKVNEKREKHQFHMLPYALVYGEKYPRRCASARPLVKEMGQSPHCKRKSQPYATDNERVTFSPFVRTCFHTVNISRGGEYIRDAHVVAHTATVKTSVAAALCEEKTKIFPSCAANA